LEDELSFKPGESVLSSGLDYQDRRSLEEEGIRVISIPYNWSTLIDFYQEIYGEGVIVSADQLIIVRNERQGPEIPNEIYEFIDRVEEVLSIY